VENKKDAFDRNMIINDWWKGENKNTEFIDQDTWECKLQHVIYKLVSK